MSQKRLLGIVIAAVVLAVAIAPAYGQQITHQTTAAHGPAWLAWLEERAQIFTAETGIEVNIIQTASSQYGDSLLAAIAAGVPPDVTDIIIGSAGPFVKGDLLEDLRPYLDRDGLDDSQWPPVAIEGNTTAEGKLWRMPAELYTVVTYFNADMFREIGLANPIELGEGWNWDALYEAARLLTIDRGGRGAPDQYGIAVLGTTRWQTLVRQAGGSLYNQALLPTESRLNSPEVLEATRFYLKFASEGLMGGGAPAEGISAMQFTGPGSVWMYQDVLFDWDVAVKPKGPNNRASSVNANGFQILAGSRQKDAAWQWVRFLTANEESQMALVRHTGRLPAFMPALLRYNEAAIDLPKNWTAFIETATYPQARTPYMVANPEVNTTINRTLNTIWAGTVAPESALEDLHRVIDQMLKQ